MCIKSRYPDETHFMESQKQCEVDTLEMDNFIWNRSYYSVDQNYYKYNYIKPKTLILGQEYNTNKPQFNIGTEDYRWWYQIKVEGGFNKLISCSLEPPTIPCTVSNYELMNAEVEVPIQALEKYQRAPVWKDFWNLKGVDGLVSIEEMEVVAAEEVGRYDLTGKAVAEDYRGIVIVRYSDGTTSKTLQR